MKHNLHIHDISKVDGLSQNECEKLLNVTNKFAFRATEYYLNLINWDDPNDPIRQIIIPRQDEIYENGDIDIQNELIFTVAPGLQHKYKDTALLLCNSICAGYCRYCFRKRLFMKDNSEVPSNFQKAFEYIKDHPEINNVILSGGDPLMLSTRRLREFLVPLSEIPHVRVIRLGSKTLAFDPSVVLENIEFFELLIELKNKNQRIYLMTHFDHPRELTNKSLDAIKSIQDCGVVCLNQCPLINGVNDNAHVLAELFENLSFAGCTPYYLFQCSPTEGNNQYLTTIVDGYHVFSEAVSRVSGIAGTAKYCFSHKTGKIEILLIDDRNIYLKYHRTHINENINRVIVCERNNKAKSFEDLRQR